MSGTITLGGKTLASHSNDTDKLSLSGDVGILSGTTSNRPVSPSIGTSYYNTELNAVEMYVGQSQWLIVQYRYKWMYPIKTSWMNGIISPDGQIWWSQRESSKNYGSVILNRVFPGDFEVIVSFQRDYVGAGIVFRDNANLNDFVGDGADPNGLYFGGLTTSGFSGATPAYGHHGLYPAPTQSGTITDDQLYYYKTSRVNNTVSFQYSTTSSSGPWTNFSTVNQTSAIQTSNEVIVGFGEASNTEILPLTLISVTEG